jgi:hypothetical protein
VIPDFLKRAEDRKPDVYEYAFNRACGRMTLDLSWVPKGRLRTRSRFFHPHALTFGIAYVRRLYESTNLEAAKSGAIMVWENRRMSVELLGYSERGMMNALCFDMLKSQDVNLVQEFLSWFDFPFRCPAEKPCFKDIQSAKLIVEQSFSDFGDLDLLILLEHTRSKGQEGRPPTRQAVLIEAKVSTDTNSWQTIEDRFNQFLSFIDGGEVSTSNLFVQLHRKVRLVESLKSGEQAYSPDLCTPRGSLGNNHVVRKAEEVLKAYIEDGTAWYGAIVPDDAGAVATFARDTLSNDQCNGTLRQWDTSRWGFLSWQTVKGHVVNAREGRWPLTMVTFTWNAGQIFREPPPAGQAFLRGQICCHDGHRVYVVSSGRGPRRRVAELDAGEIGFFWKTMTVPEADLHPCADPVPAIEVPMLPIPGSTYSWINRNDGLPPTNEPHTEEVPDETDVVVDHPSWWTTRVRLANDPLGSPSFLVYTHYLRRNLVP